MEHIYFYDSEIGPVGIGDDGRAITHLLFGSRFDGDAAREQTPLIRRAKEQLDEYLSGRRSAFELPLAPRGTEFQRGVWRCLLEIPYGQTATYAQIAAGVGNPKATRAVGGANNKNPIAIFLPCHRVIGTNGSLTGYAGGLEIKQRLLEIERGDGARGN